MLRLAAAVWLVSCAEKCSSCPYQSLLRIEHSLKSTNNSSVNTTKHGESTKFGCYVDEI
jgi:hypothetical protein